MMIKSLHQYLDLVVFLHIIRYLLISANDKLIPDKLTTQYTHTLTRPDISCGTA